MSMPIIEIRNKNNTADKNPPSGYASWLDFWEKMRFKKASRCEAFACPGSADVGGHVIKAGEGNKEYILPLCYTCNNKPEGSTFLAWADDLVSVK